VAHGASSVANGAGVRRATSGVAANFTVQAYDRFRNKRSVGGDTFHVKLSGPFSDDVPGVCASTGDGTHACSYVPRRAGLAFLSVWLGSSEEDVHHVRGSPFQVSVSDGAPSGTVSIARGPGLGMGGTVAGVAGVPSFFTVQVKDAAGNNRSVAGDRVAAVLSGPARVECAVQYLSGSSGGVYELSYLPLVSGVYTLRVSVADEEVSNGPFMPLIVPAQADGGSCEVIGGFSAIVANISSFFTVVARDMFGNRLTRGGNDFVVQLLGPDDPFTAHSASSTRNVNVVIDQGDGTYVGSFTPPSSGPYRVHVALALGAVTSAVPVIGAGLVAGKGGLLSDYSKYRWQGTPLPGIPVRSDLVAKAALGPDPTHLAGAGLERGVRWSGFVKPEHTGKCTFYATSNIISLRVGGTLVIDMERQSQSGASRPGKCSVVEAEAGLCEYSGTLPLRGGILYEIYAEWAHSDPVADMGLKWGSLQGSGAAEVKLHGTYGVAHASRAVRATFDVSLVLLPGDPVRISCEERDVRGCEGGFFETRVLSIDRALMTISIEKAFPGKTSASVSLFRRARMSTIPRERLFYGSSPVQASPFSIHVQDVA